MDWYRDHRTENIVEPNEENDLSNISSRDLMEANVENQYVNTQVMNDVTRMMNQLPPTQREVVYMRFYQDMSFKEIAETTGCGDEHAQNGTRTPDHAPVGDVIASPSMNQTQ